MHILCVQGVKGGVGTTTVAANLAAAMHAQGLPTLVIDLCAQNSLRFHFDMPLEDYNGFAVQLMNGLGWHQGAYQSHSGIHFLPFGQDDEDRCVSTFQTYVQTHPDWLERWLAQLDWPEEGWVLFDCPVFPSKITEAALALADTNLLVANPDTLCFTELHSPNYVRHTRAHNNDVQWLLINRYCPSISLERDIVSLLKTDFADILLPITIHRDENLREALAYKQPVLAVSPTCQSTQDFSLLALWLTARQARLAEDHEKSHA